MQNVLKMNSKSKYFFQLCAILIWSGLGFVCPQHSIIMYLSKEWSIKLSTPSHRIIPAISYITPALVVTLHKFNDTTIDTMILWPVWLACRLFLSINSLLKVEATQRSTSFLTKPDVTGRFSDRLKRKNNEYGSNTLNVDKHNSWSRNELYN